MEIKIQLDSDIPFEKAARVLDTLNGLQIEHVKEIQLDYEPPFVLNLGEARAVSQALRQILDEMPDWHNGDSVTRQTLEDFVQKLEKYLIKSLEGEVASD
ncbi:MAG: hypothetical protein HPY81_08395 [Firmicutes bacterium]|nr:hypothetical protein [Bacillota bacterium]